MKTIIITTKYGPITLLDDDERSNEQLVEDISELLRSSNITILKTSTASAVIRPSLVSGIVVQGDTEIPTKENTPFVETTNENEPEELEQINESEAVPEDEIDIIKDMD
jgi:hypothetical protein